MSRLYPVLPSARGGFPHPTRAHLRPDRGVARPDPGPRRAARPRGGRAGDTHPVRGGHRRAGDARRPGLDGDARLPEGLSRGADRAAPARVGRPLPARGAGRRRCARRGVLPGARGDRGVRSRHLAEGPPRLHPDTRGSAGAARVRRPDHAPAQAGAGGRALPRPGGRLPLERGSGARRDARGDRSGSGHHAVHGGDRGPQGGRPLRRVLDRAGVGAGVGALVPGLRSAGGRAGALPLPLGALAPGDPAGARHRGGAGDGRRTAARLLVHRRLGAGAADDHGHHAGLAGVPALPLRRPAGGQCPSTSTSSTRWPTSSCR